MSRGGREREGAAPAVAVITKIPRPGHSKTRLARSLGEEAALALHRAMLEDVLAALDRPEAWQLYLIHDRPEGPGEAAELAALSDGRALSLVPDQPDLAHELLASFRALTGAHEGVVIVSADVPHLEAERVQEALDALGRVDLVLGPGPDGGYYLVGQREAHDVFTPIPMSTGAVERATVALAGRLGLAVESVATMTDIDEAQDLLALVDAPPEAAPRTRAAVDKLERSELAPALPRELQIEVTSRCNLRCSACLRSHTTLAPDRDLELEAFRRIVGGLPALERVAFQLNGEPLLAPHVFTMIAEVAARGAWTVMNSNGVLLDEARRAALLASGLHELRISMDGATAATVRAMAGADVFERVSGNVAALVRERGGAARPRVGLWMIATLQTLPELPELIWHAARLGADEVYVQRLVLTGRGAATEARSAHGRVPDGGVLASAIEEAERVAAEVGVALRASGRQRVLESLRPVEGPDPQRGCFRPWRSAVVTAEGRVLPCCISSFTRHYDDLELGDLREATWADIWNGERYRTLRRGLLEGEPAACCQGCGVSWSL